MKKMLLVLLVVGSVLTHFKSFAAANPVANICGEEWSPSGSKGGHETWPWAIARPFPWTSIQGMWTTMDNGNNNTKLYFSFRVTRSTDKIKQLAVEIYEGNTCKKASMRGVGVMSFFEKNTVRVNMNNVLLKMALFNTSDLDLDRAQCGYKALGATFYDLTDNIETSRYRVSISNDIIENRNVLLRKISSSPTYKCNKN